MKAGIGGRPWGQPRRWRLARLSTPAIVALACTGCSGAVAVAPPTPAAEVAEACAEMAAQLPAEIVGVGRRRATDPPATTTAAWGDPPVSWRCGVPKPAALESMSILATVNGIDWFPEELTGGYLMTTVGRVANVEVTVPTEQGPAAEAVVDLTDVIVKGDPLK